MRNFVRSIWKPLVAILAALVLSWLLLTAFGYDAGTAFGALFQASFKNLRSFGNTLNKASPLLFTGIGVAFALRGNVFNIGADGQFLMGATAAAWVGFTFTGLPGPVLMLLMMLAGALAGAAWGFIPGILKAKYGVSEVITTIMFNYIAIQLIGYLVRGPFRDLSQAEPQSYPIAAQGSLPYLLEGTKMHPGFLMGCILAVLVFVVLFKTYFGYQVRAVGFNPTAAKYGGISVNTTVVVTMAISGAIAGLGGAIELAGSSHYLYETISNGFGFTAIAVSILAANNPIGVIFTSLLFGFLDAGSTAMQRAVDVSASFVDIFQGIIIIFVAVATVRHVMKKHTDKPVKPVTAPKSAETMKGGAK